MVARVRVPRSTQQHHQFTPFPPACCIDRPAAYGIESSSADVVELGKGRDIILPNRSYRRIDYPIEHGVWNRNRSASRPTSPLVVGSIPWLLVQLGTPIARRGEHYGISYQGRREERVEDYFSLARRYTGPCGSCY